MVSAEEIQNALRQVTDQRSFVNELLRRRLHWPVELEFGAEIQDIAYEYPEFEDEVLSQELLAAPVLQLPSLEGDTQQPWGIFILQFANPLPFTSGRGFTGPLRRLLRKLIRARSNRRGWDRPNLLFICTHEYRYFRFAYFRSATEAGRAEPLAMFGWEPGVPPRTVCDYNLRHLEWPQDPSDGTTWLKQWACAFDKEPLTREFFKRFDKVLEHMKADLEECQHLPSAEAYSRSQLLLERMIFAYFLQNRGWLNRQRNYLTAAFEPHRDKPDNFTFYEEALEPLFWTLASAPDSLSRLPGVPFLNGGLFDDDEFEPSLKRMKNNPPLRIRNSTFEFAFSHLLEAFNFTVREDTPLDQDVAVDPEMLGKVFESIVLHAEAEADYNAPDKRKATGSYYTPRIVVHFICREALRLYLKGQLPGPEWDARIKLLFDIDPTEGVEFGEMEQLKSVFRPQDGRALLNVLRTIKTCDPAVGSGAFPVGLLHELVNLRRVAETVANGFVDPARREGSNWVHETKADIVENSLYGVDIQQQAIEICRLRLWLSLIVDYDLGLDPFEADPAQFEDAIRGISRLPNLEMNFRRGDSLLDMICDVNVRIEYSQRYRKEYEQIHKLSRDLHRARKGERKRKLRVDILRKRLELTEKVLGDEIKQLQTEDSNLAGNWFGETQSESQHRRQIAGEIEHLQKAMLKVGDDHRALEKIATQPYDSRFYPRLRKLEGAEFDAPFNFAWRLDFADIFQHGTGGDAVGTEGGFDLILGNPPFVTARNPIKRQLYRERWPRVCEGNYLLVSPFIELSFQILRRDGQLGFIVSNAFARRDIGKPLVEKFFPTVHLQKVVDCSGLLFPGHGTPTCLVFAQKGSSTDIGLKQQPIRVAAILPGGGDLRTPPEESALWHTLAREHDNPGFNNGQVVVADRKRDELSKHPWNFDASAEETKQMLESKCLTQLSEFTNQNIGRDSSSQADDVYYPPVGLARRFRIDHRFLKPLIVGEQVRNWEIDSSNYALWPYTKDAEPYLTKAMERVLAPFKELLANRSLFNKTTLEAALQWFEYREYYVRGLRPQIVFPYVATHGHFAVNCEPSVFNRHGLLFTPVGDFDSRTYSIFLALLNSSVAVFWLKQYCFNKGAGADEERDRFEFAGGRVEQLPIAPGIVEALHGKTNGLSQSLSDLSKSCWEWGRKSSGLAMKGLFEMPGEAYHAWNSALPGRIKPDPDLGKPFASTADLRERFAHGVGLRDTLRAKMTASQEEMDWLVYAAYSLISLDSPAVSIFEPAECITPITREQRAFVLWQQAEGDFSRACSLIPDDWPQGRKTLWRARLECLRDNKHIRRIEQPVYKRRWDEQWKVGNTWQCGPIAYDAEFVDAFDWWLSEKAEWWLEHEAKGGPVALDTWTATLRNDSRVQAAWPVVKEALDRLGRSDTFERYFRNLVKSQSVPDNIPWAVPWDELEKKMSIPGSVKRVRGKLNVPRERFRFTSDKAYVWAGQKMFDGGSRDG